MTAPNNARQRRHGPVRRTFRWCRRLVLSLFLLAATAVLYLNQIGLPEFAKRPLLAQLRDRGLDLDFSRIRLRFGRGVVAEHVNLSRRGEAAGEKFHAEELQLRLRWSALLELRAPEIVAFTLRDGSILLPLADEPGRPPFPLAIDHVYARIRFAGPEHWELESLDAHSQGGSLHAHGTLTNVSVLRSSRPRPTPAAAGTAWKRAVLQTVRLLDRTHFDSPPDLGVGFVVDLRDPALSAGDLRLRAAAASNEWGRLDGVTLRVDVPRTVGTNALHQADLRLAATRVVTPWADVSGFDWNARAIQWTSAGMPERLEWTLGCQAVETPWTGAASARASGRSDRVRLPAGESAPWGLPAATGWARATPATNGYASAVHLELHHPALHLAQAAAAAESLAVDLDGFHDLVGWRNLGLRLSAVGATSRWASVASATLAVSLSPRTRGPATDAAWGPWARWTALRGTAGLAATNLSVPRLSLARVSGNIAWNAPALSLTNLEVRLGEGTARGDARLDVADRRASVRGLAMVDAHRIEPLLTTNAARWLRQFAWPSDAPPRLEGEVAVSLPSWTNRQPDWRGEVLPTLTLAADVSATNAGFRGLMADTAHGRVALTNRVWSVRGMDIRRPDGTLAFDYDGSELTKDYHFRLRAVLSPLIALPLLDEDLRGKVAGQFSLGPPPRIEGDVWGRWLAPERTGLDLHIVATNFVVRGEPVEWADGHASFTNLFIAFRDVHARSAGKVHVPGASYDIRRRLITFTNTTSSVPVQRVARVIGPKITRTLSAYRFTNPPAVWLEGAVGVQGPQPNDLRLDVRAGDFSWWRLHGTNVTGKLHLKGETIAIDGLRGAFHGGDVDGNLFFDWANTNDVRFHLDVAATNIALPDLLRATALATNRMEGRLTGRVAISDSRLDEPPTYAGRGWLRIEDGYLWGLPVFGLFSPVFDAVSPGLGQTRFTDGSATFGATNGLVTTRDMQMRSATMRLQYRGTIDTTGKLDATMEAELFRDMPLIGRLLQLALTPVTKLMEYRVRGTVMKPEADPRYLPRVLIAVLRPIATLKSLLPSDDKPASAEPPSTNPPPAAPQPPPAPVPRKP